MMLARLLCCTAHAAAVSPCIRTGDMQCGSSGAGKLHAHFNWLAATDLRVCHSAGGHTGHAGDGAHGLHSIHGLLAVGPDAAGNAPGLHGAIAVGAGACCGGSGQEHGVGVVQAIGRLDGVAAALQSSLDLQFKQPHQSGRQCVGIVITCQP